jgi:uncharacterized peroxidase-related enzyme
MPRIDPILDADATGRAGDLLAPLRRDGRSLNIYRTLAHAPAALDAYLSVRKALSRGSFSPQLREKLAIAISATNGCDYCVPAHTAGALSLGVSPDEIEDAKVGHATDAREDAILTLAQALAEKRGWISDEEVALARAAGVGDADVMEIVAHIAANTLSNYANHVAGTDVDVALSASFGAGGARG